jgi:hypothetical protein
MEGRAHLSLTPVNRRGPRAVRGAYRAVRAAGTWTLMRIDATAAPRSRRRLRSAGCNCLSFAAAALLSTSRHQDSPSIGPDCTAGRNAGGISGSMHARCSADWRASCASRASEGASSAACWSETGCGRRGLGGVGMGGLLYHGRARATACGTHCAAHPARRAKPRGHRGSRRRAIRRPPGKIQGFAAAGHCFDPSQPHFILIT